MPPGAPPAFTPCDFGRYQLLERLAVGGMAEIFRARQSGAHGFEKILVIKRILPHLAADPEFLAMFIDEAKLQCALQHPKIVQVLEFGQANNQYFIALEYIDGMDALGVLRACAHRRQRLPVRLAVHIASEVLDALDYAHGMRGADGAPLGIVHRDVSPSNIFISRRGDVKLGDFGIARAIEPQRQSKTQSGTLKGKYGYMAPEQVVGSHVDGRADQFAVGIVLAEMLMGRRLFTAPNDLDVLLMVRDAKLDRLDRHGGDIPPPLRLILNRALARDPGERYTTSGALRDALGEFLFDARQRVSAADLGAFLESLHEHVIDALPGDSGLLMMGEDTRARQEAAARQREQVLMAAREHPAGAPTTGLMTSGMLAAGGGGSGAPAAGAGTGAGAGAGVSAGAAVASGGAGATLAGGVGAAGASSSAAGKALEISDTGPFIEPASAPRSQTPPIGIQTTPVEDPDLPDQKGDFADVGPARLFARLAAERETGELVVERGAVIKEIFLVDGAPEFVSSNAPAERFGEYLVARGVISPGELSMALAILPRFQGKLGDTLVGLSLLRPLEVFRHLTRQVRDKIIDVFAWPQGRFRFYRGRVNQREAFPLGLDAFEILGAGIAGLPLDVVRARLEKLAPRRVRRAERARPTPEQFRVGAGPRELWQRLDGKRTVGDWMRRYEQPEQLVTLCRTLYLLIESDLAILE
jgi:serine/threonine-protein kinase